MRNPDTATHTIEWDEDCEAVIHAWTAFTAGEDFREGANALVAHLRKPGVSKLIVDASGIQTHDDEDRGWLQEVRVPEMAEPGIDYGATATPTASSPRWRWRRCPGRSRTSATPGT